MTANTKEELIEQISALNQELKNLEDSEKAQTSPKALTLTQGLLIGLITVTLSAAVSICASGFSKAGAEDFIAVVNLTKVVELNQSKLAGKKLSAEEINQEAQNFSLRLRAALTDLQSSSGKTLVVSSAVVAPHNLTDLTDKLIDKMGLTGITPVNPLSTILGAG